MKVNGMSKKVTEFLLAIATGLICWLLLSFLFFPIKLSAPIDVYFAETMTHMVPLKAVITIVFVLLSLFLYEQSLKKKKNK